MHKTQQKVYYNTRNIHTKILPIKKEKTEVQLENTITIEQVESGRDIILQGEGDKLNIIRWNIVIGLFKRFKNENLHPQSKNINTLILCPTREMCQQVATIYKTIFNINKKSFEILTIIGSRTSLEHEQKSIQNTYSPVLIGTPGRILQHIVKTPGFSNRLNTISTIIFEQIEVLLTDTFIHDLDKIMKYVSINKIFIPQKLCICTTISDSILKILQKYLKDSHIVSKDINISSSNIFSTIIANNISIRYQFQNLYTILDQISTQLYKYPTMFPRIVIFSPTARCTQFLFYVCIIIYIKRILYFYLYNLYKNLLQLTKYLQNSIDTNTRFWYLLELHGRKNQNQRVRAQQEFIEFDNNTNCTNRGVILFASDCISRGITLNADLVIQLGFIPSKDIFISRNGVLHSKGITLSMYDDSIDTHDKISIEPFNPNMVANKLISSIIFRSMVDNVSGLSSESSLSPAIPYQQESKKNQIQISLTSQYKVYQNKPHNAPQQVLHSGRRAYITQLGQLFYKKDTTNTQQQSIEPTIGESISPYQAVQSALEFSIAAGVAETLVPGDKPLPPYITKDFVDRFELSDEVLNLLRILPSKRTTDKIVQSDKKIKKHKYKFKRNSNIEPYRLRSGEQIHFT